MKKTAFIIAVIVGVLVGLIGIAAATIWFFPDAVIGVAARAARPHGIELSIGDTGGNPALGWTFQKLTVKGVAFDVTAERLVVNLDWQSTVRGRPAFDAIWADELRATVRPSTVGSSRVDLQACKLEYSIVSPK